EGLLPPALEVLALLVSLACDHHHVAWRGALDRERDRAPPVDLALRAPARAGEHLVDDGVRGLGARVVGGDDRAVGQLARDATHLRPLGTVAIAARAGDHVPEAARVLA